MRAQHFLIPSGALNRSSAVDAAHAEVFDLKEFLDAVFRAFAADAAFLHAAERGDLGRDDALVDADDAVFEGLGDALDETDVAAVEIGREAEFGVVGHLDGIGVGLAGEDAVPLLADPSERFGDHRPSTAALR